jgi:hypothetical protein
VVDVFNQPKLCKWLKAKIKVDFHVIVVWIVRWWRHRRWLLVQRGMRYSRSIVSKDIMHMSQVLWGMMRMHVVLELIFEGMRHLILSQEGAEHMQDAYDRGNGIPHLGRTW